MKFTPTEQMGWRKLNHIILNSIWATSQSGAASWPRRKTNVTYNSDTHFSCTAFPKLYMHKTCDRRLTLTDFKCKRLTFKIRLLLLLWKKVNRRRSLKFGKFGSIKYLNKYTALTFVMRKFLGMLIHWWKMQKKFIHKYSL